MPATSLIIIGIISPLAGIAGSLVWPMLQRRFAWSNLRILVTLVCLASLLPAYGCLGFLSIFRGEHVKFGGLTTPAEMYVLAMYFVSSSLPPSLRTNVLMFCLGRCLRRVPGLCSCVLLGAHTSWRGGKMVRSPSKN